jgi:acetoin utilization protein AcuB
MLVEKWMTRDPLTISENDSLGLAIHRLKERGIRRLPVMDDGKLIGILTDRDVKSASPSKASSLDIWELHFLLEKLKVADVMTRGAITIAPDTTIERAAQVMLERKIGGLPVVDRGGKLVGMLTQGDVFKALVEVTGVAQHKTRVSLLLPDQAGSIRQVADICRDNGGKILSILVSYAQVPQGKRELIMRVDSPDEPALKAALEAAFSGVVVQKD